MTNLASVSIHIPEDFDPYYYYLRSDLAVARLSRIILAVLNFEFGEKEIVFHDLEFVESEEFNAVFNHVIKEIFRDEVMANSFIKGSAWLKRDVIDYLRRNSYMILIEELMDDDYSEKFISRYCRYIISTASIKYDEVSHKYIFRGDIDFVTYSWLVYTLNDFVNRYVEDIKNLSEYIVPVFINDRFVEEICSHIQASGIFDIDYDTKLSPFHLLNNYVLN